MTNRTAFLVCVLFIGSAHAQPVTVTLEIATPEHDYIATIVPSAQASPIKAHHLSYAKCGATVWTVVVIPMPALTHSVRLPTDNYCYSAKTELVSGVMSEPSPLASMSVHADTDGDGVFDFVDNCLLIPNSQQVDSNNDGFGNWCDGDLNNDGFTNSADAILLRAQMGKPSEPPTYNVADLNQNGAVNSQDFVLFRKMLGKPPGPGAAP